MLAMPDVPPRGTVPGTSSGPPTEAAGTAAAGRAVLAGIKVLDLSRFIAGPLCGQILGDLGADVVKVEGLAGEDSRQNSPQYGGKSLYTALYNRNKRAISLKTRTDEGREVLRRLAAWADVVLENFRPGVLDRMGLDEDTLRELNPDLVVVSISGYGSTSRRRNDVLFDCVAQAGSGLMSLNADEAGLPRLGKFAPSDTLSGVYAALGVVSCLLHRRNTGQGQRLSLSVFDTLFSALGPAVPHHLINGGGSPNTGNRDEFNAPVNAFRSQDGYVYLHAGTQAFWRRMCTNILQQPDLVEDPRFASVAARMRHRSEAEEIVTTWTSTRPGQEIEDALAAVGIPCSVVADVATAATAGAASQDAILETTDADGDRVIVLNNPLRFSVTPTALRYPPPLLGEHTDPILTDLLGLAPEEVERLHAAGVVTSGREGAARA